jgi:hypothetical protein
MRVASARQPAEILAVAGLSELAGQRCHGETPPPR